MTSTELRRAQVELGLSGDEMARELGISRRGYFYRLSGDLPIRRSEATAVNLMLAVYRMAEQKGRKP